MAMFTSSNSSCRLRGGGSPQPAAQRAKIEEEETCVEDEEHRTLGHVEGQDEMGVLDGSCRHSARLAAVRAQRRSQRRGCRPAAELLSLAAGGEVGGDDGTPQDDEEASAVVDAHSFWESDEDTEIETVTMPRDERPGAAAPMSRRRSVDSVDSSAGATLRAPAGCSRRHSISSSPGLKSSLKSSLKSGARASEGRGCSFSSVDIREHERIAGDNPCVRHGVPLAIGWGYLQHQSISLDEFESHRGPPRSKREMVVPSAIREQILREEHGVEVDDIIASMREVALVKKQRRHTVGAEPLQGLTELTQSARRKLQRVVRRTSTAKEQQKLWDKAHQRTLNAPAVRGGALERAPSRKETKARRCTISSADVRENGQITGDNPCGRQGAPLAMAKKQRRRTMESESLEGLTELSQSARRTLKRLVRRTSTAEEEEGI